jgi:hypothetical protein
VTRRKRPEKRRSSGRRSSDLLKLEVPVYAAYLILIVRLLAFLTVQLHIDPTESATTEPVAQQREASAIPLRFHVDG